MKKNKNLSRREFIKLSSLVTAGGILLPKILLTQECDLTTSDILGPYYNSNAPFRTYLASPDEPGTPITISGIITAQDCEAPLANILVEVWHANDDGCYSINQICDTGNFINDEFNLRGKMLTNEDGYYEFHTIQPGHYQNRPKHFHIKFTAPDDTTLVTQIYFEGDPYIESDPWAQNAVDRILSLTQIENGLIGEFNIVLDTEPLELLLGDVNFDGILNISDVVAMVNIILGISQPNEIELYSADINQDGIVNIVDVISLVNILLNQVNKNIENPDTAKFEISDKEIKLLTRHPIAGIQIELEGSFNSEQLSLPNGWESYYHDKKMILINLSSSTNINPETIFRYNGKISVSNIIVCGWNEKLIQSEINPIESSFNVDIPFPNPFNPSVKIKFNCKLELNIKISVFNIRGKFLEIIFNSSVKNGSHEIVWEPKSLPSGVYLIKFDSEDKIYYRQVIYMK